MYVTFKLFIFNSILMIITASLTILKNPTITLIKSEASIPFLLLKLISKCKFVFLKVPVNIGILA